MDNFFGDLFGNLTNGNSKDWERELFVLYKTDYDKYRSKLQCIKLMGYKVLRNSDGLHKIIRKQ